MATKTKRTPKGKRAARGKAIAPKKAVKTRKATTFAKPYDAKKYAGSVPAFASLVAEDMKQWRDDR